MAAPGDALPLDRDRTGSVVADLLHVLAEPAGLDAATRRIVSVVGEGLGWDVAALWAVDPAARVLRCLALWTAPGCAVPEFELVTREARFPPGVGLPGQVWERGTPLWVTDVAGDPRLPRAPVAAREGVHAAFGFPLVARERLFGVIELFSTEPREEDGELLSAMVGIGRELGRFLEHRMVEEELARERERLSLALDAAQAGVWDWDVDSGSVTWSETLEALYGLSPGTFGGTFDEFVERVHPDDRERVVRTINEAFEAGSAHHVEHRVIWPDGTVRWIEGKGRVVHDERGRVTGMAGVALDITERKRAEQERAELLAAERAARAEAEAARQQLAFLAEAGATLSSSLDYQVTLERLARLVVPRLADWCVVLSVTTGGGGGPVEPVVVAHPDPEKEKLARDVLSRYPFDPSGAEGAALAIRTAEPVLYPDIPPELLRRVARDETHLDMLERLGFRSAMIVPLIARGRTLGALTLASSESSRVYGPDDLALAELLARRAALAIDNARLFLDRSEVARALQRSLLPPHLPDVAGIELAARFLPGNEGLEVGGDFYDVFSTGPSEWVVVVGDVCGTGAEAAALTGVVRHAVRAAAMQAAKPSEILAVLNEALLREDAGERFCTVACARLVVGEGRASLTVSSGGHPLPLLLRGGSVEEVACSGTLLGVLPEPVLSDRDVELAPGDAFVLYTDGVTEARSGGVMFGHDRLVDVLRGADGGDATAIAERIEEAVVAYSGGIDDDVAVFVLRVPPLAVTGPVAAA